ncbi:MAG: tetratricopeptide repeat protein, partial [Pyrinomonadaceae bacterium]
DSLGVRNTPPRSSVPPRTNDAVQDLIESAKKSPTDDPAKIKLRKDLEDLKKKSSEANSSKNTGGLTPAQEDAFLAADPSAKAAYNFWDVPSYEDVYANASESIKIKPTSKMYQLRAEATMELLDKDPMLYDLQGALKDINRSIELSSRNLDEKYTIRGDVYVELKDLPKALESYTKAIEANPTSSPAYLERGKIYATNGFRNWISAIADFDTVIEKDATNVDAYNGRGYAYFELGKKTESVADFKRALAVDRTNKYAKYNLNELANNRRAVSMEDYKFITKVRFV